MTNITAGIYFTMAGSHAVALKKLGIDIKWHYCVEEFHEVFSLNFPKVPVTDSLGDLSEVDIIVGSPPCIGMSGANPKAGMDHAANQETLNFAMVVEVLRPKGFVMEMVPMIVRPKYEQLFSEYTTVLQKHYDFKYEVVNFADYGVPHRRKRFIIIGTRKDLKKKVEFTSPAITKTTIKDAFEGLPRLTEKQAVSEGLTRKFNPKWKAPWSAYTRPSNPFQLRWDGIAPCVTAIDTGYFKHPDFLTKNEARHRLITWREAARLMGYPDSFQFTGQLGNRFKEISWGVPCKGIQYFIKDLLKALK